MSSLFCHIILVLSHHPCIVTCHPCFVTSSLFCHIILVLSHVILVLSHVILVLSHHAGDSSDDFVVIIPPCFDPHAPLAGLETQHREAGSQEGLVPLEWEILPSPTGPLVQVDTPITNEEPPKRVSPSSSPKANKGVAPNSGRRTLRDATLREPLSVATGLVNSVANFVKDVHFSRAQNSQSADLVLQEMLPGEVNDLSGDHTEEEDLDDLLVRVIVCLLHVHLIGTETETRLCCPEVNIVTPSSILGDNLCTHVPRDEQQHNC